MLAGVYCDGAFALKERPLPRPGPGDVLIKVEASAFCATDAKILTVGHRQIGPGQEVIIGHEFVGRVAAVGEGSAVPLGGRFAVAPNVGCGRCEACRLGLDSLCVNNRAYGINMDGGMAEYVLIGADAVARGCLVPVPESLDARLAVLAEAMGCCYRGLDSCDLRAGETALIVGLGAMGLFTVMLARAMGASCVIASDVLAERRSLARDLGADVTVDPASEDVARVVREATGGRGADVVMVTVPRVDAQMQGLQAVGLRGRINFFAGLPKGTAVDGFPTNLLHYQEVRALGNTGARPLDMERCIALMAAGRLPGLERIVTHTFALSEIETAAAAVVARQGLKLVVEP